MATARGGKKSSKPKKSSAVSGSSCPNRINIGPDCKYNGVEFSNGDCVGITATIPKNYNRCYIHLCISWEYDEDDKGPGGTVVIGS
jgi:hypothetical protein